MYTITHNGRPLFAPQGPHIAQPMLHMEANRLTTMEFTIYPNNPEYDLIAMRTSEFRVYRDGSLMVALRPVRRRNAFNGGVTYSCEELAACLDDVLIRPQYGTTQIKNYLNEIIELAKAYGRLQNVYLGNVSNISTDTITYVLNEYAGGWETIQSKIVSEYGGYIIPRYVEDVYSEITIYIDWLTDADLPLCSQTIEFGKNMSNMFIDTDGTDMFNVLIPLGADQKIRDSYKGQPVYFPLDISSVNNGKDYLENAESVALYGRREKVQKWEDIESAATLKSVGQQYLNASNTSLEKSITLSAADLHNLNVSVQAFNCMQRVRIKSPLYGVDATYTVNALELPLGEPKMLSMTLGDTKDVMTDKLTQNRSSARKGGQSTSSGKADRAASADTQIKHDKDIIRNQHEIEVQADRISLVVNGSGDNATIKAIDIVRAINEQATGHIVFAVGMLDIDGIVAALQTKNVAFSSVRCGQLNVNGEAGFKQSVYCESSVTSEGKIRSNTGFDPGNGNTYTGKQCSFTAKYNFVVDNGNGTTSTVYGRLVSNLENNSILYLGAPTT